MAIGEENIVRKFDAKLYDILEDYGSRILRVQFCTVLLCKNSEIIRRNDKQYSFFFHLFLLSSFRIFIRKKNGTP